MDDEPHTIEVLRSVNAKDALYVKYDASTLGCVLKYMRDNGFTEMKPNFKHPGAKGILKREHGFVVVSTDDSGKKRFKRVPTIEAAMQLQSANDADECSGAEAWGGA